LKRTRKRASGLLLHITSLPSKYGIGDFGPEAYKFADFLNKAKQRFWQVLPLSPTSDKSSYSPYNGTSAFAGNAILISPEVLYKEGLLKKREISKNLKFTTSKVDYKSAYAYKQKLFEIAFCRFQNLHSHYEFDEFCSRNDYWLHDYAIFKVIRSCFKGKNWCNWPVKIRDRDETALSSIRSKNAEDLRYEEFLQYLFFKQWTQLKKYCNEMGIEIIGDIPVYVDFNSVDVWSRPEYFKLTESKRPKFVSGVPPDLFSSTGQLWNNPLYDWPRLRKKDFDWWIRRFIHNLDMFDLVRIDHFRGFVAYWQVPAGAKTAVNGRWIRGPGDGFFQRLFKCINKQSIIAEDLGYITSRVKQHIKKYDLTGMRVLQFGFGKNCFRNPHFPGNLKTDCILYTGTHDNNTLKGWFDNDTNKQTKKRLCEYLGHKVLSEEIHLELIRLAMNSVAKFVIVPVPDILGLGSDARMNHPGKSKGNWQWRLQANQLSSKHASKLASLTCQNDRA